MGRGVARTPDDGMGIANSAAPRMKSIGNTIIWTAVGLSLNACVLAAATNSVRSSNTSTVYVFKVQDSSGKAITNAMAFLGHNGLNSPVPIVEATTSGVATVALEPGHEFIAVGISAEGYELKLLAISQLSRMWSPCRERA